MICKSAADLSHNTIAGAGAQAMNSKFSSNSTTTMVQPPKTEVSRGAFTDEYDEAEARALIGRTVRVLRPVNGIKAGTIGRVADADKIRVYAAKSKPDRKVKQNSPLAILVEAWHLTIEWQAGAPQRDVLRKSEVREHLALETCTAALDARETHF